MFDFYGSHFEYAGKSSSDYGIIIANVDTERNKALAGELSTNTVYNARNVRRYYIGDDRRDSMVEFDVEFISDSDSPIGLQDLRQIESWLLDVPGYRKLYIAPQDDCLSENSEVINGQTVRMYLNCRFVNPERIEGNGGVLGIKATMQCDSCMAWQDSITYTYNLTNSSSSSNSTINVTVDSDLKDYIYPKVTIVAGSSGGDITINNNTDDINMSSPRLTKFDDVSGSATIVMKGEINYISGEYYQKFSNKNFIRLLNGVNDISIIGDVKQIVFEFSNRRWM